MLWCNREFQNQEHSVYIHTNIPSSISLSPMPLYFFFKVVNPSNNNLNFQTRNFTDSSKPSPTENTVVRVASITKVKKSEGVI